jgi:uncharacterized protein (DUF779 family)
MSEVFKAMNEYKRNNKRKNLYDNKQALIDNDVSFGELNDGYHLRVIIGDKKYDYWPSTNLIKVGNEYFKNGLQFILRENNK